MKIQVRLFAAARQLVGQEVVTVHCPESATVAELRAEIMTELPALAPLLAHVRFAVNAQYAREDTVLNQDDEVACIPPVSGG